MTRRTDLTDDDKRTIVEQYGGGAGIVQLARAFRVRTSQINEVIGESGIPRQSLTANTPIECRLHDALKVARIGFTTQKRLVGRYVVDISVHQAPVVIEADGIRHRTGTQAQERDAARDAAHEAAGYRVFRFTGSEINTDAVKCIQQVIDACGLVPDREPVFDIRTKFSGSDHPRYVGMYELTCECCGEKFRHRRKNRKYCCHEHYILGAVKGKPKAEHVRTALAESNRTRVYTDEMRAKMSASAKARVARDGAAAGKTVSPEVRAKISASLMGHEESAETRARKSAAHLGKKHSPETAAKISAALKGKPKSPEHRAKLSASRKRPSQTMMESDLHGDVQRAAETTAPATLF
jgi:very-short-patch-repair endonuclease